MAEDQETISRPRPSAVVEYRGVPYSLGTIVEKLRREGTSLPLADAETDARRLKENPWLKSVLEEGPCVCCHTTVPDWPERSDWPWCYLMGACLCDACYETLWKSGVWPLAWERGVGGVQTVRDGVRIAPEPNAKAEDYEEIARLVGRPVTPQEVVWANLGALSVWGKPLGDVIEDLWAAGKSLTAAEFERLVERGKEA